MMSRARRTLFNSILILSVLVSCGPSDRETENYSDLFPAGIVLDQSRHPGGWKRSDCLECHNVEYNVHRNPGSPVDADALANAARENGGSAYCITCHGSNGL